MIVVLTAIVCIIIIPSVYINLAKIKVKAAKQNPVKYHKQHKKQRQLLVINWLYVYS